MSTPFPAQSAPQIEAAPAGSRLPPRLRIALWRLQLLAEVLELALAEALIEAALPENLGDRETHRELERAQLALFLLSNYILRHVGRWGDRV